MCVLCGELVMKVHWTDQEMPNKESSLMLRVGETQRTRMRERLRRVEFTNQILEYYGLKLRDWNGTKYVLNDKKGSSVIVQDLGDMWHAAEKLTGRKLDPLDPVLLEALVQFARV